MSLKIIFAGTPEFSVPTLQSLINSEHKVIAVLTQPDRPAGRGQHMHKSPVKELAEKNHIPVLQPKTLKDESVQSHLKALNADVMVVVAYGLILPKVVLNIPKHGCLNVHASILPRWRGAAPIHHAILSGDQKTGVTIMQMDEGLDTGDMLAVDECVIEAHETTAKLHDQLAVMGAASLIMVLEYLEHNQLTPVSQDDNHATYAHKIKKSDAKINWQATAEEIERAVRAFNAWPVAYTHVHENMLRIWDASVINQQTTAKPGMIISTNKDTIDVATGDGILRLLEIQLPGSRKMSVQDVLNSKSEWFVEGTVLC